MRIIAGTHRSRKLEVPQTPDIRPTTDKAREALFSALQHRLGCFDDAVVCDACCGSGAAGLEALSRGAAQVFFIDNNPQALALARRNAETLRELEKCHFISANISHPPAASMPCDLILLDPPYQKGLAETGLAALTQTGWSKPGTLAAIEVAREEGFAPPQGWVTLTEKTHGPAKLLVLEFKS